MVEGPKTLSHAAVELLDHMREIEASLRPCDREALHNPVLDARDAMLDTATNLECGAPTPSQSMALRLRAAADLIVEMEKDRRDTIGLRQGLRFVRAPQLRKLAERVRRMSHDDADLIANSLLIVANSWTEDDS